MFLLDAFWIGAQAVGLWLALGFIGWNLCGIIVRHLFVIRPHQLEDFPPESKARQAVEREMTKMAIWGLLVAALCGVLAYFYCHWVYRHWNAWMLVAAIEPMIGRIPGLLWEMKHGRKLQMHENRPLMAWQIAVGVGIILNLLAILTALTVGRGLGMAISAFFAALVVTLAITPLWNWLKRATESRQVVREAKRQLHEEYLARMRDAESK